MWLYFMFTLTLASFSLCQFSSNLTIGTSTLAHDWELTSKNLLDWTIWCKFQPVGFDCSRKGLTPKYRFYYDIKMDDCRSHQFGDCSHNMNQFGTLTQCHDTCRDPGPRAISRSNLTENVSCRLQPDFGQCNEYYPMWYYDMSLRACRGFSYSGCGGNNNRFPTAQTCSAVCSSALWH